MKIRLRSIPILLLFTACALEAQDDSGIQLIWRQFSLAWNQHDAHALSQVFAADADFTNWRGQHARSRKSIEERFAPLFSGPVFKDSICTGKVRMIRFVRPDIAVVDIEWEMTGARTAEGAPRPLRKGLLDWVCERQGQDWRIVAFHDVDFTAASIPSK